MSQVQTARLLGMTPTTVVRRSLAVLAGAFLVAIGAQVAIPLPGTPVPVTLQVPAVLVVGGLLGPRLGAASMAVYLAFGAAGVPVFAPIGAPGFARLFGPTGGYLLALPLGAAVVGVATEHGRSWSRVAVGVVAGLAVVHLGGVAQLAILSGDVSTALALGSAPFLLLDLLKLVVAGAIIQRFGKTTRALL
jgi:biotin transport system substrate-specific component